MAGIIAFNNHLKTATVFSETTESGFPFSNCVDGRTSTTVGFEVGATRTAILNLGSAKSITAAGFARSNLFATGATITLAGSSTSGGTYTDFATFTPTNSRAMFTTFGAVSWQYVRVSVSGHSADVYISDIYVGDYVDLPANVDSNFAPPELSDNDEVISNLSYTKELVGIVLKQKPRSAQFKFDALEQSWIDTYWGGFVESAKAAPFYWLWKSGAQPFYCWPEKSIGGVKFANGGKYLSVSFKVLGIIE